MAKEDFTKQINFSGRFASIDKRYANGNTPYASTDEVISILGSGILSAKYVGFPVLVKESGWTEAKEYWVQPKGTTPETYGLVEKGAGVTDYEDLENLPKINNVELKGSKTASNLGLATEEQGGKADTAIQGVSVNGTEVTPDPTTKKVALIIENGKSAYQLYLDNYEDEHGSTDGALDEAAWLESLQGKSALQIYNETMNTSLDEAGFINVLKQNYPMEYVVYDQTAAGQSIGTAFAAIDQLAASASTAGKLYLMPNDGTTPTGTELFVTVQTDATTYRWYRLGALSVPSNVLTEASIVNGFTGGVNKVLSAEAGKALNEEINGAMEWADITSEIGVIDGAYCICHADPMPQGYSQNTETTSYSCAKIRCTAGQKFKLTTKGNNDYVQAYVFADESRNKLLEAKTSMTTSNKTYTDEEITAPADSYWLYLNTTDKTNNPITLKKYQNDGTGIKHDIEALDERVETLEGQSVVDNLNSTSTSAALSANQGRILNEKFIGSDAWGSSGIVLDGDHKCYNTNNGVGGSISSNPQSTGNSLCSCGMVTCKAGDKFKLYGAGGGSYTLLYAFTGDDGKIIRLASNSQNTRENGLELTAEEGETRLYVNFVNYSSATDKLDKYIHTDGVDDKIEQLEDAIPDTSSFEQKPWEGKTIVLFGDSISEYKGTGNKRWSDFAEEVLGATIINCAIGGSDIHRRGAIVPLFSTSENYAVGDKLFNDPNGVMCYYTCIEVHTAGSWNGSHFACAFDKYTPLTVGDMVIYQPSGGSYGLYECTTAHLAGNWDDSHFTYVRAASELSSFYTYANLDMISMIEAACSDDENRYDTVIAANTFMTAHHIDGNDAIISAYTAIDWTKVDAVVVMGGANDFGATNMVSLSNEQDAYDASKVLGAINSIVRTFCGKYKSIPLYFSTDTVRWFNYGASAEEINFCDTWYGYKRFDPTESVARNEYVVHNPNGDDVFNAYYCSNPNGHQGEWDADDFSESKLNVITYTEFFDVIKAEWKKLHIPVIDLYNMLGWNMWNFSQYFPTNNQTWGYDGTHPRLGFKNIGEYIARWLIAHKNA